jgi:hypothetical protein
MAWAIIDAFVRAVAWRDYRITTAPNSFAEFHWWRQDTLKERVMDWFRPAE